MLAATTAKAADTDWYRVSIATDLSFRYVDMASIYDVGGLRRAWVAIVYQTANPTVTSPKDVLYLAEVDCVERKDRTITFTAMGRDRVTLFTLSQASEWTYWPGNHPNASIQAAICLPKSEWGEREFRPVVDQDYRRDRSNFIADAMFGQSSAEDGAANDAAQAAGEASGGDH